MMLALDRKSNNFCCKNQTDPYEIGHHDPMMFHDRERLPVPSLKSTERPFEENVLLRCSDYVDDS